MIDASDLKSLLDDLKALRKDTKAERVGQIGKKALRDRAEQIGSRWFNDFSPIISSTTFFSADVIERYSAGFARLIKLSAPSNQKKSYLDTLDALIKPLRNDLILPIQQGLTGSVNSGAYDTFFSGIADAHEDAYLQEAIACAKAGFCRAAVVLGWSAAVDHIHRKIEAIGFTQFNVTSAQMASQTKGRYKRFNQTQNVGSLSELREVFDTTILWITEGMALIDSNQHTRLRSCFEMRCHGAHPGDAPITEYNLLSFFSDIDQIVLSNPKFRLQLASP